MIVRIKTRGRNATGKSRSRDRWSKRNAKLRKNLFAPDGCVMPYGKFKGRRFADLPRYYLVWMNQESTKHRLKASAAAELKRRWAAQHSGERVTDNGAKPEYFPGGHEPVPGDRG